MRAGSCIAFVEYEFGPTRVEFAREGVGALPDGRGSESQLGMSRGRMSRGGIARWSRDRREHANEIVTLGGYNDVSSR
jgi:hypothetical protein